MEQPDRADEKERIEAAGGKILNWNGWRVQGVLATSRAFGKTFTLYHISPTFSSKSNTIFSFLIYA